MGKGVVASTVALILGLTLGESTAVGQMPTGVSHQIARPATVTFAFRAPGQEERVDRDVKPPANTRWLLVSLNVSGAQKGACNASDIVIKSTADESFAAMGIATTKQSNFIKLDDIPLGVGRGPSAWSVLRGASGSVSFSVMEAELTVHLLFAIPTASTPAMLQLCKIASTKLTPGT